MSQVPPRWSGHPLCETRGIKPSANSAREALFSFLQSPVPRLLVLLLKYSECH